MIDLSLKLYPIESSSFKRLPSSSNIESRESFTPTPNINNNNNNDLKLYLIPFQIPKNKKENKLKTNKNDKITNKKEIIQLPLDSDNELDNIIIIDNSPEVNNNNKQSSSLGKRKYIDIKPKKKRKKKKRIKNKRKKQKLIHSFEQEDNINNDILDLEELNKFIEYYKNITFDDNNPPQKLIEEFYKYSKYRKDISLKWETKDFIYTFLYLKSRYILSQVLELSSYILGCNKDKIKHNMMQYLHSPKKTSTYAKRNNIKPIINIPYRSTTNNKHLKSNNTPKWKNLLDIGKFRKKTSKFTGSCVIDLIAPKAIIYSWSNAWIGLITELVLDKKQQNQLHEIFYSDRWIRERYITKKNNFQTYDGNDLIKSIEDIIPRDKYKFIPYIIACITEKPIINIRTFFMTQENELFFTKLAKISNPKGFLTQQEDNIKQQLKEFLNKKEQKQLGNITSSKELLKHYSKIQENNDSLLLRKLCEKSRRILTQSKLYNSGGFFVINSIDDSNVPDFTWITENKLATKLRNKLNDTEFLTGCNCKDSCSNSLDSCECMEEMRSTSSQNYLPPYTSKGLLNPKFKPGFPIYECNSACSCGSSCINRVVQNPSELNLVIFKDRRKGWGVKTLDLIEKGRFVCEYMGELITSEDAEIRGRDYDERGLSFLLDLDLYGRDCQYTLDATHYGNIARFFNHSCDPNIQIFYVFVDILDWARPKICFFSKRDIQPGEEITFDYKYELSDNSQPKIRCFCETPSCRGWLV